MQMLYSMNRDAKLGYNTALKNYQKSISDSYSLYHFNLYAFSSIAAYAETDKKKKMAKLLPTEEDKAFIPKLSKNGPMQSILQNQGFKDTALSKNFEQWFDEDTIRLIYAEFVKTDDHKHYLSQGGSVKEDHIKILLSLFKFCNNNEVFLEKMEDYSPQWVDDKSLVVGAIKKTIKALPATNFFFDSYKPSDETVKDFGEVLFKEVCQQDEYLLGLIEPTLKNWDVDRVAIIDMILLKMAICELLHFPTIPSKVTLNEFVEIAKSYSTEKSKDFINGILDRLMKKLEKAGKIKKKGRGLID